MTKGPNTLQVPDVHRSVWQSYMAQGDFAISAPDHPEADASGMFHVKLADWEVESEKPGREDGTVVVRLRRKHIDDQGRTE